MKIGPVQPEKSLIPWSCKCSTLSIALLQCSWDTKFKNLIQEKQKSWACNFWASCNSWSASPLSQSIFWANKRNLLVLGAPKVQEFCKLVQYGQRNDLMEYPVNATLYALHYCNSAGEQGSKTWYRKNKKVGRVIFGPPATLGPPVR